MVESLWLAHGTGSVAESSPITCNLHAADNCLYLLHRHRCAEDSAEHLGRLTSCRPGQAFVPSARLLPTQFVI